MRADRWARFTELFDEALELELSERRAWLERLDGEDAELRSRLEEWLREERRASGFLEAPLAPGASWERGPWLLHSPGERVGRHRVRRVIGIGGSSVVYEAEQEDPRRSVALKVFQSGFASERELERFAEEARILASLRHPGVAQVYEAGSERGRSGRLPWIAMELVRGALPITMYALAEELDLRARLTLFARVCDAVAHGHQRGIIHRDLKPANVLVDDAGEPKVIDFGVARVLGAGAKAAHSGHGLHGTLPWMSPEQLGGDPRLADTRADVYALGVMLHELVCGELPRALGGLSGSEALERLRSAPPEPSAKLRAHGRDLEAVVWSALAPDPEGRYRTAGELAADLRRILAREPVVARRSSVAHHLRLALARHRRTSVAYAVAAALLVGALALGALRAREVEARERARAAEVTRFLKSVLALASPAHGRSPDLTLREVLDDAARRIDVELGDAPDARAELHALVGSAWRELGRLERAEGHCAAAVRLFRETRPRSRELACALSMLSEVLLARSRGADAEAVLLEARAVYGALRGLPELYLGVVTNKLAEARRLQGDLAAAEAFAREAHAIYLRSFGERHEAVAAALQNLAAIQRDRGALAEAEASARASLDIRRAVAGEESLAAATTRLALAEILLLREQPTPARAQLTAAEPVLARLLPPDHPSRARAAAMRCDALCRISAADSCGTRSCLASAK